MASSVDVVIAVDGMEAEQARVTALFSDTLASDETTVEEQTNLMQTSRTQHECDDQSTAPIAAVDTLADVPTGRHELQWNDLGTSGVEAVNHQHGRVYGTCRVLPIDPYAST